jgi:hypothetical protein
MSATSPQPGTDVLKARDPADLLAVVPYRLGFHPRDSLVVLTLEGPRRRFGFTARLDLPPLPQVPELARQVVEMLERQHAATVLLIVYADDDTVAAPLVLTLEQWLEQRRIDLVDAFRSDGRRWYCYTCDDACCPDEGTPYDISAHRLAAEHVLRGVVALPDREALRAQVAPVHGERLAAMQAAFDLARAELLRAFRTRPLGTGDVDDRELRRAAMRWVRRFVERWLGEPRPLTDDEAARLAIAVQPVAARDMAWALMSRETADRHRELWEQVLTRVVPPYEPAVACLTAFACWLQGHGAMAWCAVDRALDADPEYSWAGLIVHSLENAVSPEVWTPIPVEEVERFAR